MALQAEGARPQRVLWASTSTKDPGYDPLQYAEQLIGPDTLITLTKGTLAVAWTASRSDSAAACSAVGVAAGSAAEGRCPGGATRPERLRGSRRPTTLPQMSDDHRAALLDGNRPYAYAFDAHDAPKAPARRLFVLTCMDARVDPLRLLGLQLGDLHVIRNAGGRVTDDVVRSLVLSSTLLGTDHVAVIHHTDCELGSTTDEEVRADLAAHGVEIGELWTGAFVDLDDSVRADVDALRGLAVLHDRVTVSGYVYDVATGRLHVVDG